MGAEVRHPAGRARHLVETEDLEWVAVSVSAQSLVEPDIRLAIDDFGTGHAALAYLKNLPADMLKVDMIFVRGIGDDPRAQRLLQAIVRLAQFLDFQVVAVGVERRRSSRSCRRRVATWSRASTCPVRCPKRSFRRPSTPDGAVGGDRGYQA